jgi:hypothetical protein
MKILKERKPLLIKILAVVLLVLLCCNLPEEILFRKLCTEQDRDIPPHSEVLVSACKRPIVRGVPGGEVLFVYEERSGKMYLLDLRTGEKRKIPNDRLVLNKGIFLSSELVWLEGSRSKPGSPNYNPDYILDLNDGKRYELLNLSLLPRLEHGKFDPKNYAYIQASDLVYIHHSENTLIALSSDFRTNQNGRVSLSLYSNSSENGEVLEQQMKDLGVDYEVVDFSLRYADVPSPTGKYFIRDDGIYFSNTNTIAVEYKSGFMGWYFDDSALIFGTGRSCYIPMIGANCLYSFRRPAFKFNLPKP